MNRPRAKDADLLRRGLVLALAVSLMAAEAWAFGPRWHFSPSPAERVRLVFLQAIAAAYIFTLGAVLGSFLNVVIYRLPRGLNIVRPRSRCPACATPISLRDNIPVFGWLFLRGKCRICGGPISPRYPLVEAAVGSLLLLLSWLEVRLGGINLPLWTPTPLDELMILSCGMPWGNFLMAAYHAWLLIALLVMALIQWDGLRVPPVIVRLALAVGLLLPLAWPWLHPVPYYPTTLLVEQRPWWHAAIDGLAGGAAGLLIGGLLASLDSSAANQGRRWSLVSAMMLIGVFLGWQAAASIGAVSAVALIAVRVLARIWPGMQLAPLLLWSVAAAWFYVPLWKQMPLLDL